MSINTRNKAASGLKAKAASGDNRCCGNTTGPTYFVPQGSPEEFMSLWNNIEAGSLLPGLYKIQ